MCYYPAPVKFGMLKGVLDLVETGENRTLPETRNFAKWLNGYLDSVIPQSILVR